LLESILIPKDSDNACLSSSEIGCCAPRALTGIEDHFIQPLCLCSALLLLVLPLHLFFVIYIHGFVISKYAFIKFNVLKIQIVIIIFFSFNVLQI